MEFQAFKMRIPHDNRVRDSFAPEFHLRQNSNNTSHLIEDGNDSGINDHITSARFNFPEENEDQQNIQNNLSNCELKNPQSHLNSQQMYQNQQLKYQKKNIELQDYSSNGKQNLNSNSNYNTQRTNLSNQTLSEQFTNTVVKDRQPDDFVQHEVEEIDDDSQYQQQNRNHYIKYSQQSHYNQLLIHHHQQQQQCEKQKQQKYQHQKSHSFNILPQQKYIIQDSQIEKNLEQLHNQSQGNPDYIDNISDIFIEDGYNKYQNRSSDARNINIQQQITGKQMIQKNIQQQQNYMSQRVNNGNLNLNTNGIPTKQQYLPNFLDEQQLRQQQKNAMVHQNQLNFNESEYNQMEKIYQHMGNIEEFNIDQNFQKGQYINIMSQSQINMAQQQQQYQQQQQISKQMIQYNQQKYRDNDEISQPHPGTILQQIKKSTKEQIIQQNLQQQQSDKFGVSSNGSNHDISNSQIINENQNFMIDQNSRTLSRQNSDMGMYQNRENKRVQSLYSNSNLQKINDQRNYSGKKQKTQQSQLNYSPKQNKHNTSLQQTQNTSIQQIDKQAVDEHSNNTSNNEDGIVNISSIKKKIQTNTNTHNNTPIQQNNISSASPFPFKEQNTSQIINNKTDQVIQQPNQSQKYFKNTPIQQNSLIENKENNDTSFNKSQSENNHNYQNKQGETRKESISPNARQIQQNRSQPYSQNNRSQQQKIDNEMQVNYNMFDISADENIQDQSYSVFIGGNMYFDDEFQSQNTSINKQQKQNIKQNGRFTDNQTNSNISQNQSNNNTQKQNLYKNSEADINVQQKQILNDQSDITQIQDHNIRNQQQKYYNTNEYNHLEQQQLQQQIVPINRQQYNDQKYPSQQYNKNDQKINQNSIPFNQQFKNNEMFQNQNKQKSSQSINKTTQATSTTQSTSITFQTQGVQKDSQSKENNYNLCNLTTEGKRDYINENKIVTSKHEKSNSDGEFEQIEFEQDLDNEDNLNSVTYIKNEEQKLDKSLNESKNNGKSKEKNNLSINNEVGKKNDNKSANKSNLSFQPNKEEYDDIYILLQHERNKNNSLEEKLCNKSQLILKFQKMMESVNSENEQLKQEINEKDKQITNLDKNIQQLQKMNKESQMKQELIIEKELLLKQQDAIQSQNESLITQKENLQFQIEQLLDQNKNLESEIRKLSQSNQELISEFKQRNVLLTQQTENITSKNEEIENLKKIVMNLQQQDPSSYYRKKNYSHESSINNNYENLLKKQAQEKGSLYDSMNGSSTGIDSSLNLSIQGHPPRKNNIPSSSQSLQSKHQQSHRSINQGANGSLNKNGNSLNINYATVYSNQSQEEANASYSQNFCKARSSSFSSKYSDQQSLQNSSNTFNQNNNVYDQKSQQSGSQPHSNKNQQSDTNKTSHLSQSSLINFSVTELMRILNISSEKEILHKVKELMDYKQGTSQFVNCVVNMVQQCAPSGYFTNNKPDLKQSWRVLKKIMNKYLSLKMNLIKDQADQELINKVQSYLQITEKEKIIDKIANIQTENQKLTRIVILVKKNFNFEWTQSLAELEKAIEMENQNYNKSRINIDHLPQQPSQITFNGKQQFSSHLNSYSNRAQNPSQCININNSSSSSPHLHKNSKKEIAPIQTQDFPIFQQQQMQVQNIHSSTASSQRIDSANSNHIVHHNLIL